MAEPVYFDLVFDLPSNQAFTYRAEGTVSDAGGDNPKKKKSPPAAKKTVTKTAGIGKRAAVPFGKRELTGFIIEKRDTLPPGIAETSIKTIRRVVDEEAVFDERDVKLAKWISGYYFCGLGQALSAMIPSGRKYAAVSSFSGAEEIAEKALELSDEQSGALNEIIAGSREASPPLFYLYGITGSGKTEVFLRAAEFMLKNEKSVIYLVPEISLTHQTADAIKKRFGEKAAAIHSGLSPAKRMAEWSRMRRGEVRIVVGPRSAVFSPVKNLGLIIIDEEQDGSFKSGNTPRYHARQTAMRRCSAENALLVMGSATPSAEAWKLINDNGIKRLNLSRRLSGGSPPEIIPVSLEGCDGCLSPLLKEEIRKTAEMKRQTILFLNRRGFAYFFHCPSCGYELTCKNCSVSLTWHKSRNKAICHYCGYQAVPPTACPECGSLEAGFTGFGTEMIEEEVRRLFPDLKIARVDADTTAGEKLKETLDQFRSGEIDLLLGTQMVAKGLNFPGVRLVGVVLADTGLHLPDFRAAERTFSLVVQVAGRSGRFFPDGKVIVQTLRPHDPAIVKSCALDIEGFFEAELCQREALFFPPYTRLIRFTFRSRDAARADKSAARFAQIAGPLLPPGTDALGPSECPLGIISNQHRRQLIIRGKNMGSLHAAAGIMLARYDKGKDNKVYLEVDVDPVSLL